MDSITSPPTPDFDSLVKEVNTEPHIEVDKDTQMTNQNLIDIHRKNNHIHKEEDVESETSHN